MNILVINAGSSSLKYQLLNPETQQVLAKGLCERIGIDGKFTYKPEGKQAVKEADVAMPTHNEAIKAVLDALVDPANGVIGSMKEIDAVGHRVVHGGEKFARSVLITEEVMAAIQEAVSNIPASGGVPINTITIWSGSVEDIPAGWVLCDGQDGRPDLRGRFVLGAGGTYNPGAAGGSEEVTLTVDQLAKHSHGQYVPASATGSTSTGYTNLVNPASTSNPVSGRPYKDGLFGSSTSANQVNTKMQGNNEPHENMPPYYALCYIIKVSGDAPSGIEEFDTEDGWHVRKWSDGYIEMFHSRDVQVTTDMWSAWGSIFSVSVDKIPAVNYPVLLVRKYNENTAANYPFSDATGLIYGPSHEDKTQNIGFFRGTEAGVNLTIKLQYRVCGTWK